MIEPDDVTLEQHRWAVFCAASAEYLAQEYGLEVPGWTSAPELARLDEPWFHIAGPGLKKPTVRARYEQSTPEIFKQRNIFCGDRVFWNKTQPHLLPAEIQQRPA